MAYLIDFQKKPICMGDYPPLSAIKADRHFSAQVLYQIERIKDINDEMVAQIRRSKFVVANLIGIAAACIVKRNLLMI